MQSCRGLVVAALGLAMAPQAHAFPPYRSTDAATADPWALEVRLGFLRLTRRAGNDAYSSPLLRINFGLPHDVELISELEYWPSRERFADGAFGVKWVPRPGPFSLGVEALLLLPITGEGGWGVEATLIGTYRNERTGLRVHLNLAGFRDGRPAALEKGWKASGLAELKRGRFRPGLEVFLRRLGSTTQVLVGPGLIVGWGRSDVRVGFHVGLTSTSADSVVDLWAATAFSLH